MKSSLGISNSLEEISSLSHSVVFLYFFALATEEGFLISPCCSLGLCIQMEYLSFSPLPFASLLFIAICKASSDNHFAFLHLFFCLCDLLKILHSTCQQIWKTQKWPQDQKRSVFIPILKKGKTKECSNYRTVALISHASKVTLKIPQARLQQYVN